MKNRLTQIALDFVYLLVGVLSVIISIHYSERWFNYNGFPVWCSYTIAIIYVLFLNIIFQASVSKWLLSRSYKMESQKSFYIKAKKYKLYKLYIHHRFNSIIIMVVWTILASYSMISTIGGQYNQLSKIQSLMPQNIADIGIQMRMINNKIQLISDQIEDGHIEKEILITRLSSVKDVDKSYQYRKTTQKTETRLDELKLFINNKYKERIELENDKIEMTNTDSQISHGSAYSYFERILKIKGYIIQFILSFFPSVVIDFFAPISFSMFIFRKNLRNT